MPSKAGDNRFSMQVQNSADIVSLFNISRASRTIVKCHSTDCKINDGNCRNVNILEKAKNLCPHLEKLRKFYLLHVLLNDQDSADIDPDSIKIEKYDDETAVFLPDEKVPPSLTAYYIKRFQYIHELFKVS